MKHSLIKKLLPQTLLGRSLLIIILPVILIQISVTYIFFDRHWVRMTNRLAFAVSGEISVISELVEIAKNTKEIDAVLNLYSDKLNLIIDFKEGADFSKNKDTLITYKPLGWGAMIENSLEQEMQGQLNRDFTIDVDFQEKWVEIRVLLKNGVLYVSLPQRRLFSSSSYIFLLWVFSVSLILLIIAILFMRNQIRPIRRLALSAERFGKGLYDADLKIEGAIEVRQAGKAFLDMKTRIKRQIEQRTDMLAGVSHDLRTPLTRLKLQLAMLGDSPDIDAMKLDISDMEKMIEGYLNFVRGEDQESVGDVDFITLVDEVITSSKRQGCEIHYCKEIEALQIKIRTVAIKRALNNIISNAEKYADEIWVNVSLNNHNRVRVVIEDNGPSIPEDKYEQVFRPFYRIDGSRNLRTGGVGLGLPITMDIIHSHGGEIWLDQSPKGGLMVNIELPV